MTPRKLPVVLPLALAATLAGCVERGGWKSAPRLEPQALSASQALDFGFEIDFWGRNRALLAAARSGVEAAEADRAAARLALTVAVARAYVQLDLWYQLLDVTNENLRQQSAILELTQQRVSAG